MDRNILVVTVVSAIFGTAIGLSEFILPYYLDSLGFSFANMGFIFAAAALTLSLFSVIIGAESDVSGRKTYYALSLALASIATLVTPVVHRIWELLTVKVLSNMASSIREAMHPVLLYDHARLGFTKLLARTRGFEWTFQGVGQLVAGSMLLVLGFDYTFLFGGLILLAALILFTAAFQERMRTISPGSRLSLGKVFSLKSMSPNLWLIAFAFLIFTVGMSTSHSFIMPLFFTLKFGVSPVSSALIMCLHRLSLGVPMFFTGLVVKERLKWLCVGSLIFEGATITLSGLAPDFTAATALWLSHDVLGAAVWIPAQATLIQRFSGETTRGRDTNTVQAITSTGWVFGPILTGFLASVDVSLPFIVSGVIVISSSTLLLILKE